MSHWITSLILPLVGLLLSVPVAAQTFFKSTMPDGSVVFSDKPAPGAAKVESIKPDVQAPAPKAEPAKPGASKAAPVDPAVIRKLNEDKARRERAEAQVRSAEKALSAAEAALAKGEEPLPGERTGIGGGKSRLNEDYWKRQRKLKDDVENARANLERARAQAR